MSDWLIEEQALLLPNNHCAAILGLANPPWDILVQGVGIHVEAAIDWHNFVFIGYTNSSGDFESIRKVRISDGLGWTR